MITLITGAPGAGKSNALVEMLIELDGKRAIYANGVTDLTLPHIELTDPHKWHESVPDGSAIVIDEVQRIWRSQDRSKVGPDISGLETHRHRGLDFWIVTQHPSLLHPNVRKLVGRHVHVQDHGILGRKWYEWTECSDSLRNPIHSRGYKLNKKAQGLYKSASIHIKPVRSIPRVVWVFGLCIPIIGFLAWKVQDRISGVLAPPKASSVLGAASPGLAAAIGQPPTAAAAVALPGQGVYAAPTEPAAPAAPTILGCVSMGKRCECLRDDHKVATVELSYCEMTAKRGGAGIPYPHSVDAMAKLVGGDPPQPPSAWYPQPQRAGRATPPGGPSFTSSPPAPALAASGART